MFKGKPEGLVEEEEVKKVEFIFVYGMKREEQKGKFIDEKIMKGNKLGQSVP